MYFSTQSSQRKERVTQRNEKVKKENAKSELLINKTSVIKMGLPIANQNEFHESVIFKKVKR
jgi:hypothetical protein